jgi:hypothetical protein
MLTSIKLTQNLSCEYICKHVQNIVTKYQKEHPEPSELILTIDIKKPYDNNELIPKIEHKNIDLTT